MLRNAPLLCTVELSWDHFYAFAFPLTNLTHFKGINVSHQMLSTLFRLVPSLTHLTLQYLPNHSDPPSLPANATWLTAPSLKYLKVAGIGPMRPLLFCLRVPNLENFACVFPIVPNEEPVVSNVLLLHFGSLITHLELQTHSKYFDIRSLWRDAPNVTHLCLKSGPDAPLLSDGWLSHTMSDVSAERRVSIKSKLEVLEFRGPQGFSWTALADMLNPPDEKMETLSAKIAPYAQLRRTHLKRVDLCLLSRFKPIPTRIKHRLEKAQENGLQLRIRDWMGSHLISPSLE